MRITAILLTLLCTHLYGQDMHFTQFQLNALHLNPANTGRMDGNTRASLSYRNQWSSISSSPYRTLGISADKNFAFKGNLIGAGLLFLNDVSGPGDLQVNQIYLSGAYHKYLGDHSISIGIQPGIVAKSFNNTTFPDQFNDGTGLFDPSQNTDEPLLNSNASFFDLNAGIIYAYNKRKFRLEAGQAFWHILQPNESFTQGFEQKLKIRGVTYVSFLHRTSDYFHLQPVVLYNRQNKATESILGLKVFYPMPYVDNWRAWTGLYHRNNINGFGGSDPIENVDAMAATAGVQFFNYTVGLSYDVNISELQNASDYRGGFEIFLQYEYPLSNLVERRTVPCFRY